MGELGLGQSINDERCEERIVAGAEPSPDSLGNGILIEPNPSCSATRSRERNSWNSFVDRAEGFVLIENAPHPSQEDRPSRVVDECEHLVSHLGQALLPRVEFGCRVHIAQA